LIEFRILSAVTLASTHPLRHRLHWLREALLVLVVAQVGLAATTSRSVCARILSGVGLTISYWCIGSANILWLWPATLSCQPWFGRFRIPEESK